jgi:hypothetical protein
MKRKTKKILKKAFGVFENSSPWRGGKLPKAI